MAIRAVIFSLLLSVVSGASEAEELSFKISERGQVSAASSRKSLVRTHHQQEKQEELLTLPEAPGTFQDCVAFGEDFVFHSTGKACRHRVSPLTECQCKRILNNATESTCCETEPGGSHGQCRATCTTVATHHYHAYVQPQVGKAVSTMEDFDISTDSGLTCTDPANCTCGNVDKVGYEENVGIDVCKSKCKQSSGCEMIYFDGGVDAHHNCQLYTGCTATRTSPSAQTGVHFKKIEVTYTEVVLAKEVCGGTCEGTLVCDVGTTGAAHAATTCPDHCAKQAEARLVKASYCETHRAAEGGKTLKSYPNTDLASCQKECTLNDHCNSFTFDGTAGAEICKLTREVITSSEALAHDPQGANKIYYKAPYCGRDRVSVDGNEVTVTVEGAGHGHTIDKCEEACSKECSCNSFLWKATASGEMECIFYDEVVTSESAGPTGTTFTTFYKAPTVLATASASSSETATEVATEVATTQAPGL